MRNIISGHSFPGRFLSIALNIPPDRMTITILWMNCGGTSGSRCMPCGLGSTRMSTQEVMHGLCHLTELTSPGGLFPNGKIWGVVGGDWRFGPSCQCAALAALFDPVPVAGYARATELTSTSWTGVPQPLGGPRSKRGGRPLRPPVASTFFFKNFLM